MSWKRRFWLWVIWLMGVLLTLGIHPLLAISAQSLSPSAQKCIPTQSRLSIERTEVVGKTQAQGTDYYLIAAFGVGETESSDLVISVRGGRCQTLMFNPTGDRIALARHVPQAVAHQLVLARYQAILKQRGKSKLQAEINQSAASSPQWFEEEVWALRQLGITIPSNVKVISR